MIETGPTSDKQHPRHSLFRPVGRYIARLRQHSLADLLTHEFTITEGSTLLMVAFLISAVMGVVRQVLFNAQFGAGMEASAYYAAFRLPETIGLLMTGGSLANAMVPVMLAVARSESKAAAHRLACLVLTALLLVVVPMVLFSIAFAPAFVRYLLAPGFDTATSQLTIQLTQIMLLELLLVMLIGVGHAVLVCRNQLLLPAISVALHNLTLIGGIVVAMLVPGVGIYGPAVGVVGDVVLQTLILVPGLRRNGFRFGLVWQFRDRRLREVIGLLIPNGLSGAVNYAGGIVDTAYGSLASTQFGIPAVHNALLLVGLPIRLLGIAIGQAAFPHIAAFGVAGEWPQLRRTIRRTLGIAVVLAVLAGLALLLFGRPLIAILFERGRFDAAAGNLTYAALALYALGLPAYVATEVLSRCLIALHDTRTPLITNCLQLAGRIALIPLLLGMYDILAIPIAFAITASLETLILGMVLWVKVRRLAGGN